MAEETQETEKSMADEAWHNGFYYFLQALEVLKEEPEQQCHMMGDYNTAWELQFDVIAGRYLIGSGLLDETEEEAISALVDAVSGVPVRTFPSGAGREPNLAAMNNAAWVPLRELGANLRIQLRPAAVRTYLYLQLSVDLLRERIL